MVSGDVATVDGGVDESVTSPTSRGRDERVDRVATRHVDRGGGHVETGPSSARFGVGPPEVGQQTCLPALTAGRWPADGPCHHDHDLVRDRSGQVVMVDRRSQFFRHCRSPSEGHWQLRDA
jgi:hypothetical protein